MCQGIFILPPVPYQLTGSLWLPTNLHLYKITHKLFAFVANNYTHEVCVRLLLVKVLHVT